MLFKGCLIFIVLVAVTEAHLDKYERLKQVWQQIETDIHNNSTLLALYNEHIQQHTEARERYMKDSKRSIDHFNCADSPYAATFTSPTSVHSLRPEHVSVIAALGDSLTAGNGVIGNSIFDCLKEYRGRTWSIGGDFNYEQGVKTLPNMLRKYNPHLKGYSIGQCPYTDKACSQLNVAVPGQTSQEMPEQARELVRRLNDPLFGIDMHNEWKLITLFIGGNDLCDYCNDRAKYSPDSYHAKIKEALDILYTNVPKAFVNLVQIFDITPLAKVSQGFICGLVTNSVCGCAKDSSNEAELSSISAQYQEKIRSLVANNAYDKDDFTVVLQPFFQNTIPPKALNGQYDLAYFAPDCFHFSDIGTNIAAKSLWNNMMEPIGSKSLSWSIADAYHCSQMDGLFRTIRN